MDKYLFYKNNNTRLYNADCIDLLKHIPDNTFDMVFADPPYFLSNGTFSCQNGKMVPVKKGNWDIGKTAQENFNFHLKW